MKIGILTAIWGRPRLTELVLRYYEDMPVDYRLAVYSDEDKHKFMPLDEWDYWEADNDPLSDKWNSGMEYLKNDPVYDYHGWEERDVPDLDAVIIVGSDDLITPNYIDACRYLLEKGAEYIYLDGCYFYDTQGGEMIWGYARRLGLGRCMSRSLLDRLHWQPWMPGLNRNLDSSMWAKIEQSGGCKAVQLKGAKERGYIGLDIKTGDNVWDYKFVRDNLICAQVSPENVLRAHFPSVADELLNWNKEALIIND